jgi:hypothetical protein
MKGRCKMARYERGPQPPRREYTCDEVRALKEQWKADFKKENGDIKNDIYYDYFCEDIDGFLRQCRCQED